MTFERKCPNCGESISRTSDFCSNCGIEIKRWKTRPEVRSKTITSIPVLNLIFLFSGLTIIVISIIISFNFFREGEPMLEFFLIPPIVGCVIGTIFIFLSLKKMQEYIYRNELQMKSSLLRIPGIIIIVGSVGYLLIIGIFALILSNWHPH